MVAFGVLGPVTAWRDGVELALKGPRHRAVLARLVIARGRVVPVDSLVADLWTVPPDGATSAVRTFVAALRRALEPDRPPRSKPTLLITEGPGYALKATDVDAWRFEQVMARRPQASLAELQEALDWWRGPAYAEFADTPWAHAERSKLAELRLTAIERQAEAQLAMGLAADAVPALDAHVAEHPWREDAWRLLALALYRSDRQGDALAVLRNARTLLIEQLGVDPTPALQRLETDILNQAEHLTPQAAGQVWAKATAAYDRAVASTARARLESTVGLLRNLAVTGGTGLEAAREHRLAAITAAEELGDPELTARVIGLYDVPAIWTRSDDQQQADAIVAASERALKAATQPAARARLLATVAIESRGSNSTRARAAAQDAVELARELEDPALLAFALNSLFMQTFYRAGLADQRDEIGAELITLASRHDLTTYEVLGHLIRMQARSALQDFTAADSHAAAADDLAARRELPLVAVFTTWYRAMRAGDQTAYRQAATLLDNAGMPGMLADNLLDLALQSLGLTAPTPGPTEPAADLLLEARWCLIAKQAIEHDDHETMRRALEALTPAAGQLSAGSGLINLGPIDQYLEELRPCGRTAGPPRPSGRGG
ncbi:BTAD domain-containing putative transcriptional regulator [Kribbella sp. NPDC051620]|uniref:BTAD domain-containing putative transcriptional regulator n=1 Tax=Kribbella sp. NPDC051620 TaxID=3364120 RepID=UPI003794E1C9